MRIRQFENRLEIRSPGKLNLFLDICGRRSDGFHELETVVSQVDLFDTLVFSGTSDSKIQLEMVCRDATLHVDSESNLVVKALRLLRDHVDHAAQGMNVWLTKRIPHQAGLGGGSSNAAAALVAGNIIWDLNLALPELRSLGAKLGSDIPCFLKSSTTLCRGRGERVESILTSNQIPVVVVKPQFGLSTAKVYKEYGERVTHPTASNRLPQVSERKQRLLDGLKFGDPARIGSGLFNDLELPAIGLNNGITKLKQCFQRLNTCLGHQMSGSGSSYFGVFATRRQAMLAQRMLSAWLPTARTYCLNSMNDPGRWQPLAQQRRQRCK